jgi:hypothetical protein
MARGKQHVESWKDLEVWKIAQSLVLRVYKREVSYD